MFVLSLSLYVSHWENTANDGKVVLCLQRFSKSSSKKSSKRLIISTLNATSSILVRIPSCYGQDFIFIYEQQI